MARKGGGERDWESLKLVFGCGLAKEVAALASMRKENVRDEEWKKGCLRRREVWIMYNKIGMLWPLSPSPMARSKGRGWDWDGTQTRDKLAMLKNG
ncbi:hypothetical protein Vi05172_g7820 [Venturia inaequalis]|nr:hypothetical protein Vi05172_g7820 [Venturia inaequalis]